MPDSLVDTLLAQVQSVNENLVNTSVTVKGIVADQNAAAEDMIVQQRTAGENAAVVQQAKDLAEQKAQRDTLASATKLGTNPDDASEIMSSLSDEWKNATKDAVAKRQKLQQAMDVKFLDDPTGYVKAQFQMEGLAKDADAASARRLDVQNSLQFANAQTQSSALTANALKQTATDAALQASTAEATAKLASSLDAQKIQNAGINLAGIEVLSKMDMAQINNLSTGFSVQQQVQQLQISRQQLANSTASLKLSMEERQDRMDQKVVDRSELEGFANLARTGAAVMGFPNVAAFPTAKITQLINLKDAKMLDFLNAGMQTQVSGQPVVSDNAGNTARVLSQHGAPLRPEQAPLKQFFTDVWSKATSPEGGMAGKYDNTKLDQVTRGAQVYAVSAARDQQAEIKSGDSSNIYAPPSLTSVLATPAIAKSKFYQQVFAQPMAAGGLTEFNPEQVFSMTTQAVKAGKLSYNDAAVGLQATFGAARAINNVTKNYAGFGLPPQFGYRTRMANGLGFTRLYDLTTQQDVNQLLNSRLSDFNQSSRNVLDSRPLLFN